jgi:hypothetical protein
MPNPSRFAEAKIEGVIPYNLRSPKPQPVVTNNPFQECRMIGPRIEPVTCPECGLRARVRASPSGTSEAFVDDNASKCFHARGVKAILDCLSLKPLLLKADRALREPL